MAIVLLGVAARVWHYNARDDSQGWGKQVLDYASIAANLRDGDGYYESLPEGLRGVSQPTYVYSWQEVAALPDGAMERPNAYTLAGYGYFIAGVWTLTGASYVSVQAAQAILDAAVGCLGLFALLAVAGRPRAGLIAALGYALAPPLIIQAGLVLPDALGSAINIGPLACVAFGFKTGRVVAGAVAAGLILGAGSWFRGDAVLLVPLLPLAVLALSAYPLRLRLSWGGAFLAAWVVPTLALALFYQGVYGEFHPTRPGFILLWEGIGQQENPWGIAPVEGANLDAAANRLMRANGFEYGTWQGDAFLRDEALGHMRENPGWFLKPTLQRVLRVMTLQKPPEAVSTLPDAVLKATRFAGPVLPLIALAGVWLLRGSPLVRNLLIAAWLSRVLPFAFLRDELRFEILLVGIYVACLALVADEALRRVEPALSRLRGLDYETAPTANLR